MRHSSKSTVVLVEALSHAAQHSHACFSVWVAISNKLGDNVCVAVECWDEERVTRGATIVAGGGTTRGGDVWWSLRLSWLRLASTMLSRRCRSSVCRVISDCSDRKVSFKVIFEHVREMHVIRRVGNGEGRIAKKSDDTSNVWSSLNLLAVVWLWQRRTMRRRVWPATARRPYAAANSSMRLYTTLHYYKLISILPSCRDIMS